MNDKFKQRLVGLIVVLVLLFGLTWLLPRPGGGGDGAVPSTVVPLGGAPVGQAGAPPDGSSAAGGSSAADNLGDSEAAPHLPPPEEERSNPGAGDGSGATGLSPQERAEAIPATKPTIAAPKSAPVEKTSTAKATPKVPANELAKSESSPAPTRSLTMPPPTKPVLDKPASTPPPAKPIAPQMPPAAVAAAVDKASAAAPEAKVWYVQIGSFADQGNAQTTLSLLQNIGYRGESSSVTGASGNTLYRVRLGPYPTEALARAAQDKVAHQGYPQSRAVAEPTKVR